MMLRELEGQEREALERLIAGAAPSSFLRPVRWRWACYAVDHNADQMELAFVANRRKTLTAAFVALQGAGYAVRFERDHYKASWQEWGMGDMLVLTGIASPVEADLAEWVRDA